jgi:AraC-like DNA-binding protein
MEYREAPPVRALQDRVACVWIQRVGPTEVHEQRVVPDGCVDLIWHRDRLHVAGPDTGPLLAPIAAGTSLVGVRAFPGAAPSILGMPGSELVDQRAGLEHVWGRTADRLTELLSQTRSDEEALAVMQRELVARLPHTEPPDPLVERAVVDLGQPLATLSAVSEALGVGERQLRRRTIAAVGYAPKTLQRVLRFQRFLNMARSHRGRGIGLAELAAESGYADQAHLTRECTALGGLPPRPLLGR